MKENSFRSYAEYYDQIYLNRKDYREEAEIVKGVIKRSEKRNSETLLDVGCGTGEHLKYLSSDFQCKGIDVNRDMIEIARNKVPHSRFRIANMISFSLEERFDVITCLFSSIGYVQDFNNLERTLENFYRHLNNKGLVIIEPWVFKKDFKKGIIALDTFKDEKVKFARMATSRIANSNWLIFMHYLIGEKEGIRYIKEVHKMLALDYDDYVKAFKSTLFKNLKFLKENLWDGCRGLFVAESQI